MFKAEVEGINPADLMQKAKLVNLSVLNLSASTPHLHGDLSSPISDEDLMSSWTGQEVLLEVVITAAGF